MADRNASFFGAVNPEVESSEAFSFEELQRIRGRRIEADMAKREPCAWPATHRFETMLPLRRAPAPSPFERVAPRVRVIVS